MSHKPRNHAKATKAAHTSQHLEKMVAEGRLDEAEASRLRAAVESGDIDSAAQVVRLDHVRQRLTGSVAEGSMSQEEANAILEKIASGEHSPSFRRQVLGALRRGKPGGRTT